MTSFQKIIKYGAIAFGIYLSFMIISMIIFGITAIFGISAGLNWKENNDNTAVVTRWEQEYSDITSMKIDLSLCKLTIKRGDILKVDVSNVSDKFNCETKDRKLIIEDKKVYRIFGDIQEIVPEVIIYVPENTEFQEVSIKTGVNETYIESLKANQVDLEMGAGKYKIDKLLADYAKIVTGAGETIIEESEIGELKLEGGIGRLVLTSKIIQSADIDCGVGKVELNLLGLPTNYKVKAHTGLGNFTVDGKKVREDEAIGNGDVMIKVNAGVGETSIDFIE